jgi:hypothetical protein
MFQKLQHSRMWSLALATFNFLTYHPKLHKPEHVGPFAGSLLRFSDWDHS